MSKIGQYVQEQQDADPDQSHDDNSAEQIERDQTQAMADAANKRIGERINRSAGQHIRQMKANSLPF